MVSDQDSSLVFDFGLPVDRGGLFTQSMTASPSQMLRAYLNTKIAPPLPWFYDPEMTAGIDMEHLSRIWNRPLPRQGKGPHHVFVSHIHQDHMALLPYAAPDVSVLMHRDAAALYRCVQAAGEYPGTNADIHGLDDGQTVSIGNMELTLIRTDHDTPGASGFLLRTPDGVIAFTGDWRWHGRHPERIDHFINECRKAGCNLLITEGTMIKTTPWGRSRDHVREQETGSHFSSILEAAKGLVYINILARNPERVADTITITHRHNRIMVMDAPTARFWHTAVKNQIEDLDWYDRKAEACIRILEDRDSGLPYEPVQCKEIHTSPDRYVYYILHETSCRMALIEPFITDEKKTSVYFHADGNPLTDSDPVLHQWFHRYRISYRYSSTGGHADKSEVETMISRVSPTSVVVLHSQQPTLTEVVGCKRHFPYPGESRYLTEYL